MESQLQHAHGWMGRHLHGGAHGWWDNHKLLPRDKIIFNGFMGGKMIKFILVAQLLFFFIAGTHYVDEKVACARNEGITSVLVNMPMQNLSDINI